MLILENSHTWGRDVWPHSPSLHSRGHIWETNSDTGRPFTIYCISQQIGQVKTPRADYFWPSFETTQPRSNSNISTRNLYWSNCDLATTVRYQTAPQSPHPPNYSCGGLTGLTWTQPSLLESTELRKRWVTLVKTKASCCADAFRINRAHNKLFHDDPRSGNSKAFWWVMENYSTAHAKRPIKAMIAERTSTNRSSIWSRNAH